MAKNIQPEVRAAFDMACAMDRVNLEGVEDFNSGKRREFMFTVHGIGQRNIGVIGVKRRDGQSLDDPEIAKTAGKHAALWAARRISEQGTE